MFKEVEIFATENDISVVKEVFVFNGILQDQNQTESILLDVLGRLHRLDISVFTLKYTMIGVAVSALKIHGSEQIRVRARALVDKWKRMVGVWIDAQVAEEETKTVREEAKSFQAKTDEEKPKKPLIQKQQKQAEKETVFPDKPKRAVLKIKEKPLTVIKSEKQSNKTLNHKGPLADKEKRKGIDGAKKLEVAAKRLRENYEQAENAKKKRRIQVVELHNLPKNTLGQKNAYIKSKSFATRRPLSCK